LVLLAKSLKIYLKDIKLANEAINVPIEPTLTPCNKYLANPESVKVESKTAAGTLEMNCEVIIPVKYTLTLLFRKEDNSSPILSILLKLPVMMKKETNVSSKYQSTLLNRCLAKINPSIIVMMKVYSNGTTLNIDNKALSKIKE
jgi:hypothetical protein